MSWPWYLHKTELRCAFFFNHGGRELNKSERRLNSDSCYTLISYHLGRLTLNGTSSLREPGVEKGHSLERDKQPWKHVPRIWSKTAIFRRKMVQIRKYLLEKGGGATYCTKSDFEPKRANVQFKNDWCLNFPLRPGLGGSKRRFLPCLIDFKNDPTLPKAAIFLNWVSE